jgi:hypothetical protein
MSLHDWIEAVMWGASLAIVTEARARCLLALGAPMITHTPHAFPQARSAVSAAALPSGADTAVRATPQLCRDDAPVQGPPEA